MAEFLVKVADERGRVLEQVENARSAQEVRDRFTEQGYLVYSVKQRGLAVAGLAAARSRRVKLEQFIVFNQQLVTLIRAGLPILTSLDLLSKRQRNPYFKSLLENVQERVKGGQLLSEAFEAQGVFPKIYTTTLMAGEKSGNLEEVLSRFIAFQRVSLSVRKKLLTSLVYPALLIVLVICMLVYMFTVVIPKFAELYANFNAQLPAVTRFMLALGVGAQHYALIVFPVLIVVALLLWRWSHTDAGSEWFDRLRLRSPVLGEIWLKYQVAMFARTMSTLLAGGLPLVPALETASASMQSRLIAHAVGASSERVREGRPLSRSLEETRIFPPLSVEMIEVGESTGALPAMLNSVAEFFEEDVQTALTAALALIEPVILLFMGLVVAFVLVSLYMPIFSLGASGQLH
jgi:type IV pilus assembly protein PilC